MKEFLLTAFPWVLCGIAVAIICAKIGQEKTKEEESVLEKHMALGMALGMMFGVTWNENQGLGLAIGALWGMAVATLVPDGKDSEER